MERNRTCGNEDNVPFGVPCELVAEDSDAVDGSAALEMLLKLFWCRAVVDVADIDTP